MNLIEQIEQAFGTFLTTTFNLTAQQLGLCAFTLNIDETKQQFGDINANAAMMLAKTLGRSPRDIAQTITTGFSHPAVEKIEIAGPGFLNLFLTDAALHDLCVDLLNRKDDFYKLDPAHKLHRYNVEFVSANPTGPLHLGHGRGGIIGDVLSNVINFLGHSATQEFYINDAGVQIQKLANCLRIRCQQQLGLDVHIPEDGYQGDYLVELAQRCIAENGPGVIEEHEDFFAEYGKNHLLGNIQTTLQDYGIQFDVWFSEKTLHVNGFVDEGLKLLTERGHTYEDGGALWLRSTAFGDDKDRVLRKASGELTYAAADVAYLKNKIDRGFDKIVMVLGTDHHSYVVRLHSMLQALGYQDSVTLDVILYQLVSMKASGEQVRMSKRAGNIVTLRGVIDEVGTDVARFFYLNRKADAHLEFDLDLALKKTDENPTYYIQYAYVRTQSILAKAMEVPDFANITADDAFHLGRDEAFLIKKIISLKTLLETICRTYQTHMLAYYAYELATAFHHYYGKHRVIVPDAVAQSRSRLLLIKLLKQTFETTLTLLELSKPERM